MERQANKMELSMQSVWLLLLLCYSIIPCSARKAEMFRLDSPAMCHEGVNQQIQWINKDKTFLVVGRGASDRGQYTECSVLIGAATPKAGLILLSFEACHIDECGVKLLINQSHSSDFATSTPMAKIGCDHGDVGVLYSEEKFYVKITVRKDRGWLQQYNFRINVTLVDKLPETGPKTHVVIIVGFVVLVVVGMSLWLLVKYLIRHTQRWHEQCAQTNMERAIRLYNSQESPPESDYMYTALPALDIAPTRTTLPTHRNGHSHPSKHAASARSGRHRPGDISFVHADGHIETFRMRDSPQLRRSGDSDHTAPHRSARPGAQDPNPPPFPEDGSTLGDCPPSYEEALHMPTPEDPLYVNLDHKKDEKNTT